MNIPPSVKGVTHAECSNDAWLGIRLRRMRFLLPLYLPVPVHPKDAADYFTSVSG